MILLDTNVVSESLRPSPSMHVAGWMRAQPRAQLHISAVTAAELRRGVSILPDGQRQESLSAAIEAIITSDFLGRALPFDLGASEHYATIIATRRKSGEPIDWADALIAAIARANKAVLATRNTKHFSGCGIELINPWTPGS